MSGSKILYYMVRPNNGISSVLTEGGHKEVDSFKHADIVVFDGGADIPARFSSNFPPKLVDPVSERDKKDRITFASSVAHGKLNLGICRGAQLMWGLSGGDIWQDVDGHRGDHVAYEVKEEDDTREYDKFQISVKGTRITDSFTVSSTHHQMCRPSDRLKGKFHPFLIAQEARTRTNWNNTKYVCNTSMLRKITDFDIEAYFIQSTNSFGCQFHPEYPVNVKGPEGKRHKEWFLAKLDQVLYDTKYI